MIDLRTSNTVFGVPRSHWQCSFDNYHWQSDAQKKAVIEFMSLLLLQGIRKNLLFTGGSGLGKTHLAVCLYRWGVLQWGTVDCCFVEVPRLLDEVKRGFNDKGAPDPFAAITAAKKLVVFDDLVGRTLSPWDRDNIVVRMITLAHSNNAAIVATTNLAVEQLGMILQPHELSRLTDSAYHLAFTGQDQRPLR